MSQYRTFHSTIRNLRPGPVPAPRRAGSVSTGHRLRKLHVAPSAYGSAVPPHATSVQAFVLRPVPRDVASVPDIA
eukprot:629480-Rhodomonas_salina.1